MRDEYLRTYLLVKEASKVEEPTMSPASIGKGISRRQDAVLDTVAKPISYSPYVIGGVMLGSALGAYGGRKLYRHVSSGLVPPPLSPRGYTPKKVKGFRKLDPRAHWNAMLDNVQGRISEEIVPRAAREFAMTGDAVTKKALESGYVGLGGLAGGLGGGYAGLSAARKIDKKSKRKKRRG